jgi:glycerol-3-phosphate acyltransferase PlsY
MVFLEKLGSGWKNFYFWPLIVRNFKPFFPCAPPLSSPPRLVVLSDLDLCAFLTPTRVIHLGKVNCWFFSFRGGGGAEAMKHRIVYLSLIYTSPLTNIFQATLLWSTFNQIFHTHTVIMEIVMKLSSEWSLSIRSLFAMSYTWFWTFQIIFKFLVALARRFCIFVSQPIPGP